jgi:hypothetical protein
MWNTLSIAGLILWQAKLHSIYKSTWPSFRYVVPDEEEEHSYHIPERVPHLPDQDAFISMHALHSALGWMALASILSPVTAYECDKQEDHKKIETTV